MLYGMRVQIPPPAFMRSEPRINTDDWSESGKCRQYNTDQIPMPNQCLKPKIQSQAPASFGQPFEFWRLNFEFLPIYVYRR